MEVAVAVVMEVAVVAVVAVVVTVVVRCCSGSLVRWWVGYGGAMVVWLWRSWWWCSYGGRGRGGYGGRGGAPVLQLSGAVVVGWLWRLDGGLAMEVR